MDIINNNIQGINISSQSVSSAKRKLDVQYKEKDIANSPNPAEYLGRSQVKFRGKEPKNETILTDKVKEYLESKNVPEETVKIILKNIDKATKNGDITETNLSQKRIDSIAEQISQLKNTNILTDMATQRMLNTSITDEQFGEYSKWLKHSGEFKEVDYMFHIQNLFKVALEKDVDFSSEEAVENNNKYNKPTVDAFDKFLNNKELIDALVAEEIEVKNGFVCPSEKKEIDPTFAEFADLVNALKTKDLVLESVLSSSEQLPAFVATWDIGSLKTEYFSIDCMPIIAEMSKDEIMKTFDNIQTMKQRTLDKPELFVNNENNDKTPEDIEFETEMFYKQHNSGLFRLNTVFDKATIDFLMRQRLDDFGEVLDELKTFGKDDLNLLKRLSESISTDGKPFLERQKAEFVDLIAAYKYNNIPTIKMEKMIEEGKVDIGKLNLDVLHQVMLKNGISEEELSQISNEKLMKWDLTHIHLLAKEIRENGTDEEDETNAFRDILRAGNSDNFMEYISDTSNPYGVANEKTKNMFTEMHMNYDKWVSPSKEHEMKFVTKDKNAEQLKQISNQVIEDINTLMQGPVKGVLKKQLPAEFFKGDNFILPTEYTTNKKKLNELVQKLADESDKGYLHQVWARANQNKASGIPERMERAQQTLTVLSHLQQRISDISNVPDVKTTKNIDWTIKMWDRDPQKDIFQGNYSTCCIGMGGGNGLAMPHYIMDTAFNMIELSDADGKVVGNALCYFVKNEAGQPAFVIDNIEINNNAKPSDEVGVQLRDTMTEYASRIAKDVTGKDDTPIYIGGDFNDVQVGDLPKHQETISFLGEIDSNTDEIYLDAFGKSAEWTKTNDLTQLRSLFKLK